jgi:elongation factor P
MTTSDLKRGLRITLEGNPFAVMNIHTQTPSARGASTLVKTRLRNLRTGQLVDKTFKSGDRITPADFEVRPSQYLYHDGDDTFCFMDQVNYEQFELTKDEISHELNFILPNDEIKALIFEGICIGVEIPQTVALQVTQCDPGIKGDTVNSVTKPATLETGLEVAVPLFVNEGDRVIIDTRDSHYVKRA